MQVRCMYGGAQRDSSTQTVRDSEAGDSVVRRRGQLETWLPSCSRKNVENSFEIAVALILTMEANPVMWSCLRVTLIAAFAIMRRAWGLLLEQAQVLV